MTKLEFKDLILKTTPDERLTNDRYLLFQKYFARQVGACMFRATLKELDVSLNGVVFYAAPDEVPVFDLADMIAHQLTVHGMSVDPPQVTTSELTAEVAAQYTDVAAEYYEHITRLADSTHGGAFEDT